MTTMSKLRLKGRATTNGGAGGGESGEGYNCTNREQQEREMDDIRCEDDVMRTSPQVLQSNAEERGIIDSSSHVSPTATERVDLVSQIAEKGSEEEEESGLELILV